MASCLLVTPGHGERPQGLGSCRAMGDVLELLGVVICQEGCG